MTKPELGYWDIRGLAHPIRFLLEYVGEEFTDTYYSLKGEAPNWDRSEWLDVKFTKGLDFPNLPYYIDGDVKLTQTHAILRYIARKHGGDLLGKSEEERNRVDMVTEQCMDFRNGFVTLAYRTFDKKDDYLAALPAKLKALEEFLGDRTFFAGDNLTFIDFHLYEMFFAHNKLAPEIVQKHPKLVAFVKRFEDLPKIKAYMESPKYKNLPLNNKSALFGNIPL